MAQPDVLRIVQASAHVDEYNAPQVLDMERLRALGCLGLVGSTMCNRLLGNRQANTQGEVFAHAKAESNPFEGTTPCAEVCLACPVYAQTKIRVSADETNLLATIGVSEDNQIRLAA